MAAPFKFDEVGIWSELKLEIVEKYGSAYTSAFAKQRGLRKAAPEYTFQSAVAGRSTAAQPGR
jgi:hypothetical protein